MKLELVNQNEGCDFFLNYCSVYSTISYILLLNLFFFMNYHVKKIALSSLVYFLLVIILIYLYEIEFTIINAIFVYFELLVDVILIITINGNQLKIITMYEDKYYATYSTQFMFLLLTLFFVNEKVIVDDELIEIGLLFTLILYLIWLIIINWINNYIFVIEIKQELKKKSNINNNNNNEKRTDGYVYLSEIYNDNNNNNNNNNNEETISIGNFETKNIDVNVNDLSLQFDIYFSRLNYIPSILYFLLSFGLNRYLFFVKFFSKIIILSIIMIYLIIFNKNKKIK